MLEQDIKRRILKFVVQSYDEDDEYVMSSKEKLLASEKKYKEGTEFWIIPDERVAREGAKTAIYRELLLHKDEILAFRVYKEGKLEEKVWVNGRFEHLKEQFDYLIALLNKTNTPHEVFAK